MKKDLGRQSGRNRRKRQPVKPGEGRTQRPQRENMVKRTGRARQKNWRQKNKGQGSPPTLLEPGRIGNISEQQRQQTNPVLALKFLNAGARLGGEGETHVI